MPRMKCLFGWHHISISKLLRAKLNYVCLICSYCMSSNIKARWQGSRDNYVHLYLSKFASWIYCKLVSMMVNDNICLVRLGRERRVQIWSPIMTEARAHQASWKTLRVSTSKWGNLWRPRSCTTIMRNYSTFVSLGLNMTHFTNTISLVQKLCVITIH